MGGQWEEQSGWEANGRGYGKGGGNYGSKGKSDKGDRGYGKSYGKNSNSGGSRPSGKGSWHKDGESDVKRHRSGPGPNDDRWSSGGNNWNRGGDDSYGKG